MRRRLALAAVALAALGLGAAASVWIAWTTPSRDVGRDVIVRIPPGASLPAVADTLATHGLLAHRRLFLWGARLGGVDRSVQAGRYALPRGLSPQNLLARLASGHTVPVRVTLVDGAGAGDLAGELAAAFPWSAEVFLAAADSVLRSVTAEPPISMTASELGRYEEILVAERARSGRRFPLCEGYLFPETYHFAEGLGAPEVAAAVIGEGRRRWRELLDAAPRRPALASFHEVLTLASIVEAETPREAEMPRVAAVYLNRLAQDRRLEADPTVAHAVDKWGKRILYADLATESPFNTYRHDGLPPGPICNPGAAAVAAVLMPAPDFDALFFVADGRGGHVFSRTLEEHEAAVRAYRAARGR